MRPIPLLMSVVAGLALLLVGIGSLQAATPPPSREEIRVLEAAISLPSGARPISTYRRYYAAAIRDGRRIVHGVYFGSGDQIIVTEEINLPGVLDGGCSVVNVYWDPSTRKVLSVFCNGVA